jgi:hypothetical protein
LFRCSSKVGAIPLSGTDAYTCSCASSSTLVVVLDAMTASSAFPGASSSVMVTFLNGGIIIIASSFKILSNIGILSIFPSQAYISSTVTILGSNFISDSQSCSAKIGTSPCSGFSLSYCHILSDSEVVINIDNSNVSLGAADVCVSVSNPPSIFASSFGNLISIVYSPTISSAKPVQGYVSSTITVLGSNFLVTNYTCVMLVGAVQASICRIASASSVIFAVPAGSPIGSKVLSLNFNMGGSGATAVAPGAIFNVASSPTINLISPSPSHSSCNVTVTVSFCTCILCNIECIVLIL